MESVVTNALNEFDQENGYYILNTEYGTFQVKVCKGGPAFTLKVQEKGGKDIEMDIDLVPCFVFGKEMWPVNGFKPNPISEKPEFFIVPKPLKDVNNSVKYWRLSFQEQEKSYNGRKENFEASDKANQEIKRQLRP
ncbi:hypothetical protein NQ318_010220 [Aromia moschata]|uniref:Mab-21-like nucleotidyltransferase domain-containing protein n=1 Tax=Aromia moschata TaxID=1265417 RepID=A0AAV8X857_9CUCU|nr:hypothetical protein NQ318_010220 [Aromia moschata]